VLIRNVRLWTPARQLPSGQPASGDAVLDVRVTGGVIDDVAPGLSRIPGDDEVIDAEGAALLPGLHDHHIHLRALAAARASVPVGPPQVSTRPEFEARLRAADAGAGDPAAAGEGPAAWAWLRCTGYYESVAGDLDRHVLDRIVPHRPVRIQHRTGALWIVNSAAADTLRLDDCDLPGVERDAGGRPTGRLWRLDRWLADRVPRTEPDLRAVSAAAIRQGVTGFTDATPGLSQRDIGSLAAAVSDGTIVQRLHLMAPPGMAPPGAALPTGGAPPTDGAPPDGRVTLGPVKVMLDDDTLPSLDELTERIREARARNRPVAVHCVTRVQLILTLTALDEAGRHGAGNYPARAHEGDRIEHAAIVPAELIPALRARTVVTQPHFAAERADQYQHDVDPEDLPDLWRLRSLIEAGIPLAAGSDAPFGGADPWQVAVAAANRPLFSRTPEAISPGHALSLFFGRATAPAIPRTIAPGQPADVVLLGVPPRDVPGALGQRPGSPRPDLVAAVIVDGRIAYCGGSSHWAFGK
jgi:predicted amidohydrolase YtcJ